MTKTHTALVTGAALLTLASYAFVLLVTGFVACGISGCSGGGFGPSTVLTGSLLAMLLLGLGPHGCPADQSRARDGAGKLTCSGDPDA